MKTQHSWFGVQETGELLQLRIIEYVKLKGLHKDHRVQWSLQECLKQIHMTESVTSVIQSIAGAPWALAGLVPWPRARAVSGEPVPVTNHPPSEEHFSIVQSELALIQLHSIPSHAVAGHQREEISTSPSLPPLRKVQRLRERLVSPVCRVILDLSWVWHPWRDSFDLFLEVTASRGKLLFPQDWRKHECLVWDR